MATDKIRVQVLTRFGGWRAGDHCWVSPAELERELMRKVPRVVPPDVPEELHQDVGVIEGLTPRDVQDLRVRGLVRFDQLARPGQDPVASAALEGFYAARPEEQARLRLVLRRFGELVEEHGLEPAVELSRARREAVVLVHRAANIPAEELANQADGLRRSYQAIVGDPARKKPVALLAGLAERLGIALPE